MLKGCKQVREISARKAAVLLNPPSTSTYLRGPEL